jgi:hypothetical protein
MLNLYNKKYVYLEWDDILEGKKCILADDIDTLKNYVNYDCELQDVQKEIKHEYYGKYFTTKENDFDVVYRFAYYDPNLEVKRALINGKSVQYYSEFGKWTDLRLWGSIENYLDMEDWDKREWRVKPTEIWYVIFAENVFLRVSMINNEFHTVFFKGTYEECGTWINEHDSLSSVISAFFRGDTIQWKPKNRINEWQDWKSSEFPMVNTMDENYWRIKPKYNLDSNYQSTEPRCYLSVNKNGYLEFTISQNITNDTIYIGTRKECERMMKIIGNEFEEEDIFHYDILHRLRYIINKYSHEKYKRRMTNRELSEYLAKGNGEMKKLGCFVNTSIFHCYKNNTENENVDDNILIRDFGSDEWRSPLIEV